MITQSKDGTLTPLRDLVLLRPFPSKQLASGVRNDGSAYDLILPSTAQHEEPYGRALAVGCDVKNVQVNDVVLYDSSACTRVDGNDIVAIGHANAGNSGYSTDALLLVRERDVIAVLDKESESESESESEDV